MTTVIECVPSMAAVTVLTEIVRVGASILAISSDRSLVRVNLRGPQSVPAIVTESVKEAKVYFESF
jgi:hypothetical protein